MPKKKKEDTLSDIIDRIEEDLEALRDKAAEIEDQEEEESWEDDEEDE
jgi:hypothetical protein